MQVAQNLHKFDWTAHLNATFTVLVCMKKFMKNFFFSYHYEFSSIDSSVKFDRLMLIEAKFEHDDRFAPVYIYIYIYIYICIQKTHIHFFFFLRFIITTIQIAIARKRE